MNGNGKKVHWPTIVALGAFATISTGINAWIYDSIEPKLLRAVDQLIKEEIDRHARSTHAGGVSREELKILVLDRLDTLASRDQIAAIREQITQINARLDRLEKKE